MKINKKLITWNNINISWSKINTKYKNKLIQSINTN